MFSPETIVENNMRAAARASQERMQPFVVWPGEAKKMPPYPFPYFGTYVPKGWEKVDEFFVDSSGFGEEDEPAMTTREFLKKVEEFEGSEYGWAITSAGPFQVYVGLYRKWAN